MIRRCAIVITLLLCTVLYAAPTGSLSGVVVGPDKRPIAGVHLTLTGMGPDRKFTTSEDGRFAFPNLKPGHYDVIAEKAGYEEFRNRYVVDANSDKAITVRLARGR
jgi:hypothetical protein